MALAGHCLARPTGRLSTSARIWNWAALKADDRPGRPMKPDPRPIFEAVARAGGRIERTLLVGDTGADYGAAIAAVLFFIMMIFISGFIWKMVRDEREGY